MFLVILEVSQKQGYIFSSRLLKDNVRHSQEIVLVTGSESVADKRRFFRKAAGERYQEDNLVSTGGGHTVLCFPEREQARTFVSLVTEEAMRRFHGMELYAAVMEYDSALDLGTNLDNLSKALERKKARRRASFGWRSVGVEKLDRESWQPLPIGAASRYDAQVEALIEEFDAQVGIPGWKYPKDFKTLVNWEKHLSTGKTARTGEENFLAVVHIDGNAMGARVRRLYEQFKKQDFDTSRTRLQTFSGGVQADFEAAFRDTAQALAEHCRKQAAPEAETLSGFLPIRPIILAGDDVTFVTAGRCGLACAQVFLKALAKRSNPEDGESYAACAGVALVHQKYPFHRAYDLAEELCEQAKRFVAEIDPDKGEIGSDRGEPGPDNESKTQPGSRVSAMDWHIEFGQLKENLSELRKDYETEDGGKLELRPLLVTSPEAAASLPGVDQEAAEAVIGGVRTWDFFRRMCRAIKGESGRMARGKIKNLREVLKQGEEESRFYLRDREIHDLLYHGLDAEYGDEAFRKAYEQIGKGGVVKEVFRPVGKAGEQKSRCLFFDAIEVMDHCEFFEEGEAEA